MPKLTKSVPKYRRHVSGKDRKTINARVTINGRDYILGPWNSKTSIQEYDRIVAEFLTSGRSPSFGKEREAYTVGMMAVEFLRYCKSYYGTGPSSDFHSIKSAVRPLLDLYSRHEAASIDPLAYKTVRQKMVDSGLTRQGINKKMKLIRRMFSWATQEAKIPPEVHALLKEVKALKRGRTDAPESKDILPVDNETVEATVKELSPIVADMVSLQRLIGCRPSEVCALTPGSLDRSDDVWVANLAEHKTAHHGHKRKLYIGQKGQAIIERYLDRGDDDALFRPCDAVALRRERDAANRLTPLSCGNRPGRKYGGGLKGKQAKKTAGDSYTTNSYRRAIHNACDRAFPPPPPLAKLQGESEKVRRTRLSDAQWDELQKWESNRRWSPNQLRHAAGTEVRKQFGIEAAQVTLGHATADITQVYAERDETLGKDVARKIG